jgi:hypothetical protein
MLFDRGYPSFEMFKFRDSLGIKFVMRLKTKFNTQIDKLPSGIHSVTLVNDYNEEMFLLVVKLLLTSGEVETLVKNLFDD